MPTLKRIAVVSAAFGAGFAVTLMIIGGGLYWYMSRPTPWIEDAITAEYSHVRPTGKKNRLLFYFDLTNNTKRDWSIDKYSKTTAFYMEKDGSLLDAVDHESPIFLPAGETYRIWLNFSAEYPGERLKASATREQRITYDKEIERWFTKEWSEVHGFVLFDSANHYKVRMVGGWHKSEKSENNKQQ